MAQHELYDAQAALGFLVNQTYRLNPEVYAVKYPDLDFARLVYVDSSSPEWAGGITTFISNAVGKAEWGTGYAKDTPYADLVRDRTDVPFHMAHIGYEYNIEELGKAQFLNVPLTADKANAARRAYQEFMWQVTLTGDTTKGIVGLANNAGVTAGTFPADGTGSVTTWYDANGNQTKTSAQIIRDFNGLLTGIWTGSLTVEMADTVLLPYDIIAYLAATPMSATNSETIMTFLMRNNIYTQQTGQQLTVRGVLGLNTAGSGGTRRAVAYANRQDVARLHLPMPHRFLPVWQNGPYNFMVPGVFRTGGVEVLRPGAFRYGDGL